VAGLVRDNACCFDLGHPLDYFPPGEEVG